MTTRVRVTVNGPLSTAAGSAIHARYEVAGSTQRVGGETVLELEGLDQSAIRGLLTLLWDFGHDVIAVTNETKEQTS